MLGIARLCTYFKVSTAGRWAGIYDVTLCKNYNNGITLRTCRTYGEVPPVSLNSPGATRLAPSIQEGGRGAHGRKGGAQGVEGVRRSREAGGGGGVRGGEALQYESACTRIKKKVARGSGTRLQGSRAGRTSPFRPLSGPTYIYICIRGAKHERTVPLYTPTPRAPVPGAIVLQDLDREIHLRKWNNCSLTRGAGTERRADRLT